MENIYCPETGYFSCAGSVDSHGYLQIKYLGKQVLAHRLAWKLTNGDYPVGHEVDHKNGNRLDNRISNLRLASKSQNQQNRKLNSNSSTGVKGVYPSKGRFRAVVSAFKVRYQVGYFDTICEAKSAIEIRRKELHKEFANNG